MSLISFEVNRQSNKAKYYMPNKRKMFDKDLYINIAAKFNSRTEFARAHPSIYFSLRTRDLLDIAFAHIPKEMRGKRKNIKWTKESIKEEALKYSTRSSFYRMSGSAYVAAIKFNILDEVCSHMPKKAHKGKNSYNFKWDDDMLRSEALKYKTRTELKNNSSGAYDAMVKSNTIDLYCSHMPRSSSDSATETDIFLWILEKCSDAIPKDRKQINPLELDIYVPSLNLAIEYCGLRWHSEQFQKNNNYHINKMKMCNDKGIRLITIFEDEWINRENQIKSFLLSAFNKNEKKLFARNLIMKEVPKKEAIQFLNDTHIQGSTKFDVAFGLWNKEELVGITTGGKHHRQGHNSILVLNRLAFKAGVSIAGGSSKLLTALINYSKNNGYVKIISWSDNRWSEGNVYKAMNFTMAEDMAPDYSYVLRSKRFSKQSNKKANLIKKGAIGNTEKEMALSLGLYRIWDCGKKRWVLELR